MLDIWEKTVISLSPAIGMSHIRESRLWDRYCDLNKHLAEWEKVCRRVEESDFLCCRTDKAFTAGIDFVIDPDNFNKLREGVYDNREQKKSKPKESAVDSGIIRLEDALEFGIVGVDLILLKTLLADKDVKIEKLIKNAKSCELEYFTDWLRGQCNFN